MSLNKNKDYKLFYSIKEVATELNLPESTLRYWETIFPTISPRKSSKGVRQYTREDIKALQTVRLLVKDKGMTIDGAKRYLRNGGNMEKTEADSMVIERLKHIREELLSIREALDSL